VAGVFLLYSTIWKDYLVQAFGVAAVAWIGVGFLPDVGTWGVFPQWAVGVREALTFGLLFGLLQIVASRSAFIDPFEMPAGFGRILLLLELSAFLVILSQALANFSITYPVLSQGLFSGLAMLVWSGATLLTLVFFGKKG
jgi:hypothetical protein